MGPDLSSHSWDTTRLWLELKRRAEQAESARTVLAMCMPTISAVLHDAGTAVEDFTLHDEGHAFRVAERMVDILPPSLLSELQPPEIALLLFAAYLHDIGMSPGRARVAVLRRYLLTGLWEDPQPTEAGSPPLYLAEERDRLDLWLIEKTGLVPGKVASPMATTYLAEVDQAIAYYCRDRQKAIEDTVAQIEDELRLARRLGDDRNFAEYGGSPVLPHRWHMGVAVHRDIQPRKGTYEYIDGAFRPNTRKVLELLGGVQLYKNPLVAILELLQNAFDAVREQIARQLVQHPEGARLEVREATERTHYVTLKLAKSTAGLCLVCSDSGAGMDKAIIARFFLVGGESRRPDIDRLRRECKARNILFLRSGQFGIGVLSYFLLAERVVLMTRRSSEALDSDGTGWRFETEGIGSFGELRRAANWTGGTQVSLFLRTNELVEDAAAFSAKVGVLIREKVARVPCKLTFDSEVCGADSFVLSPGWTRGEAELTAAELPPTRRDVDDQGLTPEEERRGKEEVARKLEEVSSRLHWFTRERAVANNMALARIHIPWFDLEGRRCLAHFQAGGRNSRSRISTLGNAHALMISPRFRTSWRGMDVGMTSPSIPPLFGVIELDLWDDALGTISVERQTVTLSAQGASAVAEVGALIIDATAELLDTEELRSVEWAFINWKLACEFVGTGHKHVFAFPDAEIRWPKTDPNESGRFSLVDPKFPIIDRYLGVDLAAAKVAKVGDQIMRVTPSLRLRFVGKNPRPEKATYFSTRVAPTFIGTRVIWVKHANDLTPAVAAHTEEGSPPSGSPVAQAAFPPTWTRFLGVQFFDLWNGENEVIRAVTADAVSWARDCKDPRDKRDELVSDRSKAAAWLLSQIRIGVADLVWRALTEKEGDFCRQMVSLLMPGRSSQERVLVFCGMSARVNTERGKGSFFALSEKGSVRLTGMEALKTYLGELDDSWLCVPKVERRRRLR